MNKNKRFNIFDWIWIIPLIVGIIIQIISIVRLNKSDENFSVFSVIFSGVVITGAITYIFYVIPRAIRYSKRKMEELKKQVNFQEIQSKKTRDEKLKLIKICKNCDNVIRVDAEKCNLCDSTEFISPNDKEIDNWFPFYFTHLPTLIDLWYNENRW